MVSGPLDHVHGIDPNVARAKRAVARSERLIADTNEALARHQWWLDRHCMLWADDLKRHERVVKRKRAIRALGRLSKGFMLLVPSACLALFRRTIWILSLFRNLLSTSLARVVALARRRLLKKSAYQRRPTSSVQLNFEELVLAGADTRQRQLQNRIDELVTPFERFVRNRKAQGLSRPALKAWGPREMRRWLWTSIASGKSGTAFATASGLMQGRVFASALGLIAVILVAGAIRATISSAPTDASPKVPGPMRATAVPAPGLTTGPPEQPPTPILGFSVVTMAVLDPLPLSGQTIASMMFITRPLASPAVAPGLTILMTPVISKPLPLSGATIFSMTLMTSALTVVPVEPHATTPPIARAIAVKPKLKAGPKPKLATQEPQQQLPWLRPPWWRRLPWI